jgi:hypothetical protein
VFCSLFVLTWWLLRFVFAGCPAISHTQSSPPLRKTLFSGGAGARDVRLEDFSVSNGGRELIEDATIVLAHGRRYGLVRAAVGVGGWIWKGEGAGWLCSCLPCVRDIPLF